MRKIKEFWNKLKYWQKGGIIGLLVGLIPYLAFYLFNVDMFPFLAIPLAIPVILPMIVISLLVGSQSDPLAIEGIAAYALIISPIFYLILGFIIGLIIGKLKKK